jgi:O-methyltransferase
MSIAAVLRRLSSFRTAPVVTGNDAPERPVLTPSEARILAQSQPFTLTSEARLLAVVDAVRYVTEREIPGAFAECGVWKGGSVLAIILTLQDAGIDDRDLYLYDTFENMSQPTEADTSAFERPALDTWREAEERGEAPWAPYFDAATFSERQVRETLLSTGYPEERLHFVRGKVEETLPQQAPERLALLRLDTDWYESTRHELQHLYPRLSDGGVLIIDDYGHWEGARRAVDEYLGAGQSLLLSRIDYTGRIAIKH